MNIKTKTGASGTTRMIIDFNQKLAVLYVLSDFLEPDIPANSVALAQRDACIRPGEEEKDGFYLVTTTKGRHHVGWVTFHGSDVSVLRANDGVDIPQGAVAEISPLVLVTKMESFRLRDTWPAEERVSV